MAFDKLTDISNSANNLADENISTNITIEYANIAIGDINGRLQIDLPFFNTPDEVYTALSEKWLRTLVVYKVADMIKTNDSSLNEANRFTGLYEQAFRNFASVASQEVADEFKGKNFGGVYNTGVRNTTNGWYDNKCVVDDKTALFEGDE